MIVISLRSKLFSIKCNVELELPNLMRSELQSSWDNLTRLHQITKETKLLVKTVEEIHQMDKIQAEETRKRQDKITEETRQRQDKIQTEETRQRQDKIQTEETRQRQHQDKIQTEEIGQLGVVLVLENHKT